MSREFTVKIEDIIQLLNAQWDSLVCDLVPNVRQSQGYWTVGDLDGAKGQSCVFYRGPKAGSWRDYSTDDSGDALILIEKQVTGGDRGKAILWAKQWLGIDDEDSVTFEARKKVARATKKKNDEEAKKQQAKKWNMAKAIFLSARENIFNTMAADYLFDRGLDFGPHLSEFRAVRFERHCYEMETRKEHPAIVTSITVPHEGKLLMAVHRTYLQYSDDGHVVKLNVKKAKKVLGDYRGGYIPLWRGKSKKIIFKADPAEWVVITEGIEDGMSIVFSDPDLRVICAVGLSNMGGINLPDNVRNVILVKDNDWDNPKAEAAFQKAIAWHHEHGRRVKVFKTPASAGHDVNEWLSGKKIGKNKNG